MRGGELEREERVPTRRLLEPDQRRPRQARVEARAEQLVERADAQAADLDRREPGLRHAAPKPRRRLATHRQQRRDRLVGESRQRKAKGRERRGIEPLDVVDGEAELPPAGEESQRREERRRDRPLVDVQLRLAEQQRRLERAPLDGR
jgi:hypothetical protein